MEKSSDTGSRYSLRVNPSSGNSIHGSLSGVCGFTGVNDGLYHYRATCHALDFAARAAGRNISRKRCGFRGPRNLPYRGTHFDFLA